MRPVSLRALILGSALAAGCKPGPHRPDAAPPWWKPAPGETADWDIQLAAAPFDVSMPRAMYTLDLWDAVPSATMLDYGDNAPLAVPAGKHPGAIAELHARAPLSMVVCHIGGGSIRLTDPDAKKFPGYEASPPNRPTTPAAGSAIGWSTTTTDANERFIDIHEAVRKTVGALIDKRIELANAIGCDAIAAANNDLPAYENDPNPGHGFAAVSFAEFVSWSTELSERAHDLRISIGIHDHSSLGADNLSVAYDWTMVERCGEHLDCPEAVPFLNKKKAAFAIEYDTSESGTPNDLAMVCAELQRARVQDGIVKSAALSSAYYMRCP